MTKVCCYNCCSCQGYHTGMRSVAQGPPDPPRSQDSPYHGRPSCKASKAPAVKWHPIQVASVIPQLPLQLCRHGRSDFKITLPILYFNSDVDASVRQFVFLGKCKECRWWHGDALRLDSILPPTPCAVQRTASGGSVPSLPTPGRPEPWAAGPQQWGRTDCPQSCGARVVKSS